MGIFNGRKCWVLLVMPWHQLEYSLWLRVSLTSPHEAFNWWLVRSILQRWVTFLHFSPSLTSHFWMVIGVCGYTGFTACVRVPVRLVDLCPVFPLWAYGFWESNFKQQLFVALKDSISLGRVQFGVCSCRQKRACIRAGYQFSFLIICSGAYRKEIRELGRKSFSLSTPSSQRCSQQQHAGIKSSHFMF